MGGSISCQKQLKKEGLYNFVNNYLKNNDEVFKECNFVFDTLYAFHVDLVFSYHIRSLIINKLNDVTICDGQSVTFVTDKYFSKDEIYIIKIYTKLPVHHQLMYKFEGYVAELTAIFGMILGDKFACIF